MKRIVGLTIEAAGISAPIGAQCVIQSQSQDRGLSAEVIGFDGDLVFLMPLDSIEGISLGVESHFNRKRLLVALA